MRFDFVGIINHVGLFISTVVGIGMITWFIRYVLGKIGKKAIRNKIIVLICLFHISLLSANIIYQVIWLVNDSKVAINIPTRWAIMESIQSFFFHMAIGFHIGALYLRTDSTIIPVYIGRVIKVFMLAYVIGGIFYVFPFMRLTGVEFDPAFSQEVL